MAHWGTVWVPSASTLKACLTCASAFCRGVKVWIKSHRFEEPIASHHKQFWGLGAHHRPKLHHYPSCFTYQRIAWRWAHIVLVSVQTGDANRRSLWHEFRHTYTSHKNCLTNRCIKGSHHQMRLSSVLAALSARKSILHQVNCCSTSWIKKFRSVATCYLRCTTCTACFVEPCRFACLHTHGPRDT